MEMNRGEAEKCMELGKKHLRAGNYRQAVKWFDKSIRLFPLPGAEALRARSAESAQQQEAPSSSSSSSSTARAAPAASPSSSSTTASQPEDTRPYTEEQVRIVRKIKMCKTHYDVLGVATNADENDIKKAYRKLALKLHPDKNSAPGAEDAFKAVGKAFTILSDDQKRADYDRFGDNAPGESNSGNRQRTRQHHGGYNDDDISPEDIFNMFFGGGIPRQRQHRQQYQRQQQQRQANETPRTPMQQFLQFLPLILVLCLSLFSFPGNQSPPFSLNPTQDMPVQRTTRMRNVINGIPYYVARDFERRYTNDWRDLMRVEKMVESWHVQKLREGCEGERLKQKRRINKARNHKNADERESAVKKALAVPLPTCEELNRLQE
ncbi:hypothetical protein H310_04931 [Aphanomyces invadans]|uniref:J domain-containing protein n=1 Tax=Aphanomyces invadans TaxID=157072 RepID=A0A024UBC0_9STRA|nr:hypothetical protein H310_04931 [Aphanomyces invadans]ETW03480.1 hypothetical protein H310_04931 [Aphanomyces invadans]|eukprot:XP_008867709.1 hypothetical protein H310_04931 [Aphanomyces invadans]